MYRIWRDWPITGVSCVPVLSALLNGLMNSVLQWSRLCRHQVMRILRAQVLISLHCMRLVGTKNCWQCWKNPISAAGGIVNGVSGHYVSAYFFHVDKLSSLI